MNIMNNNKRGKLVLYTGCSGVGKGTILEKIRERDPNVWVSVSNTTRGKREGEIDGVHYVFVTKEQFENLIKENGFLEYAKYCDNYYGTPKKPVEDMLADGHVVSIFILPPSLDELEKRLRNRGTEDEETIRKRLSEAKHELGFKDRYSYNVVNDNIDEAVDEIINIINKDA